MSPRRSREKSFSKVYHVIIRGINKQNIFLDDQDFKKLKKELKKTKEKYKYEIYAYALMRNHIHIVINDKNDNLSRIIQSINISYSIYFNKKYDRIGHLFQNRFKSKAIDSQEYLKNLIRYIHKNPENAGIIEKYKWTSYEEYIYKENIINSKFVLDFFGVSKEEKLYNIKKFHYNYNKNIDLTKDYELITKIDDEEAINIIKNILKEDNLMKIQNYNKNKRDKAILKILEIEGIRKIQISRLIGINKKTIERIEKVSKGTDVSFSSVPKET